MALRSDFLPALAVASATIRETRCREHSTSKPSGIQKSY